MKIEPTWTRGLTVGPVRGPLADSLAPRRMILDLADIGRPSDLDAISPRRIPMTGAVAHSRPPFTRIAEDMGDLLMPLGCFGLTGATLTRVQRSLTDKPDVARVDVVTDEQGHPRRIGVGTNPLFLCRLPDGARGVFKSMEPVSESWVTRMKEESAREIVASGVMNELGVHGITYGSAVARVEGGEHEGVVSAFADHKTLLQDPTVLEKISDPDAAIRGSIIDAWMGNFDRIVNDGNVWVQPDGRMVFGDYGCTFRGGLTALGIPKVNQRLFDRYATRENVEPAVAEIRALGDGDIKQMVERAGAAAPTLSATQRQDMVDVLIKNRDELRRHNPFAAWYGGGEKPLAVSFPLAPSVGRAIARRAMLRFGADGAPPEVVAFRVASQVRGYEPRHGHDVQTVADTLSHLIRSDLGQEQSCGLMRSVDFIAWQQVCKLLLTPEASLGLHLGLQ